jgi:phage gpG-like protein
MAFSLLEAATIFAEMAVEMDHIKHEVLDEGATILQTEAKRVLGTYDYGWPALKPSTIAGKSTGDSPLLETGDLRDSIEKDVQSDAAYIGSNDNKALWHEYGTVHTPPRPFLGGAANAKGEEIAEIAGEKMHAKLIK